MKGLLYKGTTWNDYTDIYLRSYQKSDTDKENWNSWELQYPDDYPSNDTWQPMMDLIDFCSDNTTDEEFLASYQDYFYADNLADYVVFTLALNVGDNIYKNTFLSTVDITKGHQYLISPWDMDKSLGGDFDGKHLDITTHKNRYNERAPFNRLIANNLDGFSDKLEDIWTKHYSTLFAPDSIGRRLDRYANLFTTSGAWDRESDKWNDNPVPLKTQIAEELEYVKDWYDKNYQYLCGKFGTTYETGGITGKKESVSHKGIHTLDGRKVHSADRHRLEKGIYIVDGRKILVR